MDTCDFHPPFQFLKDWDMYATGGFLESITGRGLTPSQPIDFEQALAKRIISLDRSYSVMQNGTANTSFSHLLTEIIDIALHIIIGSHENDDGLEKLRNCRLKPSLSFTGVVSKICKELNGSEQDPLEVRPLRVNSSNVSQAIVRRNEDQSQEDFDMEEAEQLLRAQLFPPGDNVVGASSTEAGIPRVNTPAPNNRLMPETPAPGTTSSGIELPLIHTGSEGEEEEQEGEVDFIPPPWAASPALCTILQWQFQQSNLAKQTFGSPDRVVRLDVIFPHAKKAPARDKLLAEEERFYGGVTSPSPDPNAPYIDLDAVATSINSRVSAGTQRHDSAGPTGCPAPLPSSRRFIEPTSTSPSPPERSNIRAKVQQIGGTLAAPPRGPMPRTCKSTAPLKGTLFTGKPKRRPKNQKRVNPQSTQLNQIDDSSELSPDEKLRRSVKLSFKILYPRIDITFGPSKEAKKEVKEYRTFNPYEVPLEESSAMTEKKKEKVKTIMEELIPRIRFTIATLPDDNCLDSISVLADHPGQDLDEAREKIEKQVARTGKYRNVLLFLQFSFTIVDLKTATTEQYEIRYGRLSPSDKKFLRLVEILHALCRRLKPDWGGHHLSLVGHLLSMEVGITILGKLFGDAASLPMAFHELLEHLNNCRLAPSGSGMTAVGYVHIILRDAKDLSNEIITDTLASTPEIPIERLSPAKHAQDLYASLINGDPVNDGSYLTEERRILPQKRSDGIESDQGPPAKRQRTLPEDSGFCDGEASTGGGTTLDLCLDIESFASQLENHHITIHASKVLPFEVSCRGEDILQLNPNTRLGENLANTIIGLLAGSVMDNTVYLGIVNYEHIGKDFGEITSLVEGIPRHGQWYMVINYKGHYQTVRWNWDLDGDDPQIRHYDPHNPYIRPGRYGPLEHQASERHIEVTNRFEEWTQSLCEKNTCRKWTKGRLHGPRQENGDTENCLLFNIWGLRSWVTGREFDGIMGDPIKYKRVFLELLRSQGKWAKQT